VKQETPSTSNQTTFAVMAQPVPYW
jgi:hypothetical protein